MLPFEFMKKTMMTGIGIALKTQSEIEELTKELIDKSKMSEEEGKKFVDDMMKKYEEAKESMEKQIHDGIKDFMSKSDIASSKELNALKKEVAELRKVIEKKG